MTPARGRLLPVRRAPDTTTWRGLAGRRHVTPGRRRRGRRRVNGGSVSIEVAILAPAFLALIVLAGVAGRTAVADETIEAVAHDAARAASISRTADAARAAAEEAVRTGLRWRGLSCVEPPVPVLSGTVNGSPTSLDNAFASGLGTDAAVVVTVSCDVDLRDLWLPQLAPMPASTTVEATFVSPLDRYRARGAP